MSWLYRVHGRVYGESEVSLTNKVTEGHRSGPKALVRKQPLVFIKYVGTQSYTIWISLFREPNRLCTTHDLCLLSILGSQIAAQSIKELPDVVDGLT